MTSGTRRGADPMRFLDANVIVDALVDQNTRTRLASLRLLERLVKGQESARTTGLVLAEVFRVLRSVRGGRVERRAACQLLSDIVEAPGLDIDEREVWLLTIDLLTDSALDFTDAHLAATMKAEGATEIYSYDTDFDRVDGITRLEP